MRRVLGLLLALAAFAGAQYFDELWRSDEVGNAGAVRIIDFANVDADPDLELVYIAEAAPFSNSCIYALNLADGQVEELIGDDFWRIYTGPGIEPRLIDLDQNGTSELLFLAEEDQGEVCWYLYGYGELTGARGDRPAIRRLGPRLGPSLPNPATTTSSIEYELPAAAAGSVRIYDKTGRLVRTLASGRLAAGRHHLTWDRQDDQGRAVAGGTYFYVLEADGRQLARKAVAAQ